MQKSFSVLSTFNGYIYAGTNSHLHRYAYSIETAGIEEAEAQTVSVYPNPTTGQLHVEHAGNTPYQITDLSGKIIETGELNGNAIDMTNQPNGNYFLRIKNEVIKIVKD
jgi:hypothetical protein